VLIAEPALPSGTLAAIRQPFETFGGVAVDAPVLQPLSLLLDLAGEAMRSRLFVVQSENAEEQALRPDFTIPVVQSHIASGAPAGRYVYEGKVFLAPDMAASADTAQPSEFLQIGAELFGAGADLGEDPGTDDARIAALAWNAAVAGGRGDLSLHLGDPGLFRGFLRALDVAPPAALRLERALRNTRALAVELGREPGAADARHARLADLLAGLSESEAAALLEEVWRMSGIQPVGGRSAADIVHRLTTRAADARAPRLTPAEVERIEGFLAISGSPGAVLDEIARLAGPAAPTLAPLLDGWRRRLDGLVAHGAPADAMRLATAFVRPFDYYDGMLFEVRSAALGADQPVAAGGRYDTLPSRFGGTPGAVGCMVRPGRAAAGVGGAA
jgi:ATP phosphoribosyltransferase regulatory subunit